MKLQELAIELNKEYGWNIVPMYNLSRDEEGVKRAKLIDWQRYKAEPYNLDDWKETYQALSIITGQISNLTILDIDSKEALNTLLNAANLELEELANYIMKTSKGYQLFYTYMPESKTRIGIKDKIDFLNGGLTFAVACNEGYECIKSEKPGPMPEVLCRLIVANNSIDKEHTDFERQLRANSDIHFKNPLRPLIKEFVDSSRLSAKLKKALEKVFCTNSFKDLLLDELGTEGRKHASHLYAGAIVAASPTISKELYFDFMEAWSKKILKLSWPLDEHEKSLHTGRIKHNMQIFEYDKEWKKKVDDFASCRLDNIASQNNMVVWKDPREEKYVVYYPERSRKLSLSKWFFKDYMCGEYNRANPEEPTITSKDIDTENIEAIYDTFDPTVNDEFFISDKGEKMFNGFKRTELLSHFLTCEPATSLPPFIGNLIHHIYPVEEERDMFLHTLAYHMTHLQVSPTTYILTGKSGTGKNMMLQTILSEIYGSMHVSINLDTMVGKFRALLKNKLLVFIDEVNERGSRVLHNVIKQTVGNPQLKLEGKGVDEQLYPHHALYVMASNRDTPFKLDEGFDRRLNITKTKDDNIRNLDWFPSHLSVVQIDEMIRKETRLFVEYLASIKLDHYKWNNIIENKQRTTMVGESVYVVDQYVTAILDKNVEDLYDLDYDFAEWFHKMFVLSKKASCSAKEFREALGEVGRKVVKRLKEEGILIKNVKNVFSIVLFPSQSDEPFKAE